MKLGWMSKTVDAVLSVHLRKKGPLMGRMQFEVGGTWGVMEMSCLDTSKGFHCISPKMLSCWAVTLALRVLSQLELQGVPVINAGNASLVHLNCPKGGSCLVI